MTNNDMTRRCLNKACQYHAAGKCRLLPGWSFLSCRRSGIATTKTQNKDK